MLRKDYGSIHGGWLKCLDVSEARGLFGCFRVGRQFLSKLEHSECKPMQTVYARSLRKL